MKTNTACFSGHRPQHFIFGFDEIHSDCVKIKDEIKNAIDLAIQNSYTTFLTGMAQGVDIWCAEEVLRQRMSGKKIFLNAIVPHIGQQKSWSPLYQKRYFDILEKSDDVVILNQAYIPGCLGQRNRYLVDNSSLLIAVLGNENGGTKNTVDYAVSRKLEIKIITP